MRVRITDIPNATKRVRITKTPKMQTGGVVGVQSTKLTPFQQIQFDKWKSKLPKNLQYEGDYDLKGLWMENPNVKPSSNLHFPDTYKLPNHPTFSNQSKYFNDQTKKYAGHWDETDSSWNYVPYDTAVKKGVVERKMQTGGKALQETQGLPPGQEHMANIEAENGEVYQNNEGGFTKISDHAPSHEDGGVMINDAERVLEDTSMDRKDKHSKSLKMSPGEVEQIFGFRPKRGVSHAKAFELTKKHFDNKRAKFNTAQKDLNNQNLMDKFSIASSKQNFINREFVPDEQDIFDTLFAHQEAIKEVNNIPTGGKENKYGGYKYQTGGRDASKRNDRDRYLKPFIKNENLQETYDPTINTDMAVPSSTTPVQSNVPEPGNPERQPQRPGVNVNPRFINQPKNQFFEPTRWYDLAPGIMELVDSMGRDPELYNPVQMHQLKFKLLNPTAAIQANQADFNAAAQALGNENVGSGVASANMSNLLAQKYKANNQIVADYENRNAVITNQEIGYNTSVKDRQSLADAQSREKYYSDVLKGRDNQRLQKLQAIQDLSRVAQLKARQNRSGNLILKMTPAFDQNGEFNGYQYVPVLPPEYMGSGDFIPQSSAGSKYAPKTRTTTTTKSGDKVIRTTTSR